ncbi:hypothetical protein [Crenothrix sp.]|uniref:tetratricopeptide repeat protein n=1 Tax=Crenothrix sp. TaxID=3100433 RepID=UPI00374D762C
MQKTSSNSPVTNKTDSVSLEHTARSKFQAGNFKEAIELYKTLLKTTENSEWRQALAQCYLQRSLSFTAKGMVKEAVVLWESYAQNSGTGREYFDHYLTWLLKTNDIAKTKKYLQQLTIAQLDEQYPRLANLLGLLIITSKPEIQTLLPQDSVFIKHLTIVQATLSAYRAGQYQAVDTQLQQLPFRSAFKDFRTLLKAVMAFSESKETAQEQLAKITTESPYYNMAKSLLACTHDGSTLITDLSDLSHKQGQLVTIAKKFNKKQLELLDVIIKQKQRLSDKLKFNLALQYHTIFGEELSRRYCYLALANYPAGQRDFNKHFGLADEFEECRLKALGYEHKGNLHDALYYWKRGVALLQNQEPVDNLKIALLMRHIASKEYPLSETIPWLEDSLDQDPDDRDTYLKIVNYYENRAQQKDDLKLWLNKSIAKFPQDIELLLIAINDATRRQAFKQATQYAQTVLKIDPVNVFAKQALFNSHLAHIRTLIKSKKFQKLDQEMHATQSLALNKRDQLIVTIMQGFCTFAAAKIDKSQGATQVAETVQQLHTGLLNAHFYVMMEAAAMNLQPAAVLKALPPLAKNYTASPQELAQFIELALKYCNQADTQVLLTKIIDKLKAPLKYSLGKNLLDEEKLLAFCQGLERIGHFELMRVCVKVPSALWKKPIGMYYRVYAESNGDASKCSEINIDRLETSLENADLEKDQRAIVLIEKFLDDYYEDDFGPKHIDVFGALMGMGGSNANPMVLFNDLPSDVFDKLDSKADELIKKMGMDRFLTALVKQYFSNNKTAAMDVILKNFDALQALSLLKAAEELNLEIHVTAADIINCVNSSPNSIPSFLK